MKRIVAIMVAALIWLPTAQSQEASPKAPFKSRIDTIKRYLHAHKGKIAVAMALVTVAVGGTAAVMYLRNNPKPNKDAGVETYTSGTEKVKNGPSYEPDRPFFTQEKEASQQGTEDFSCGTGGVIVVEGKDGKDQLVNNVDRLEKNYAQGKFALKGLTSQGPRADIEPLNEKNEEFLNFLTGTEIDISSELVQQHKVQLIGKKDDISNNITVEYNPLNQDGKEIKEDKERALWDAIERWAYKHDIHNDSITIRRLNSEENTLKYFKYGVISLPSERRDSTTVPSSQWTQIRNMVPSFIGNYLPQ